MNVLLIRSDLPESPEVLLLAGVLRASSDLRWVPSPEVIVCKLIKIWAWVSQHGSPDSDSCDYRIPSPIVVALEDQFDCRGIIDAMTDPRIDWCRHDSGHVAFCRFGEWNGADAMARRGDSVRARRSRVRSQNRMKRTQSVTRVTKNGAKTATKAHAKRDARHGSRAPSIDVDEDVDVYQEIIEKTSSSTSTSAEDADRNCANSESSESQVEACFGKIRTAVQSSHDADDSQVAKDRETAWKVASLVVRHLEASWLARVIETVQRIKPRRPYAYLFASLQSKLLTLDLDASVEMARLQAPLGLTDPPGISSRIEPPKPKPVDRTKDRERVRFLLAKEWQKQGKWESATESQIESEIDRRLANV